MDNPGVLQDDPGALEIPVHPTVAPQDARRWLTRRKVLVALATVVVLAGGAVAIRATTNRTTTTAAPLVATTAAQLQKRDLVVTDSYDGSLGFGTARPYSSERSGVVTAVAGVGTTVKAGETLFSVDLQPTVVLIGDVPAYRALSISSTHGPDIRQLEQGLVDIGQGAGVTVDDVFDAGTAAAVKRWETALGRPSPDGTVDLGDVVFVPNPVRVSSVTSDRGTRVQAGTTVLQATPTAQVVSVNLDAARASRLEPGTAVTLTMPNNKQTTGKVVSIGTQATAAAATGAGGGGGGGRSTVAVTISIDDPATAAEFDTGTVGVAIEQSREAGALAAPVTALVALAEGGYAVQVEDSSKPEGYRLVGVKVGTYADGFVGVTGDGLAPGTRVVVPK